MSKKKLSPEEFAKTIHSAGGSKCRTCRSPAWVDVIKRILTVWSSEESGTPYFSALLSYLRDGYDYPHTEHALRDHIKNHEAALWEAVKKRHSM